MDAESTICLSDLVPALRWSRPQQVAEMLADPRLPGGWWASVALGRAMDATGVDWLCERLARLAMGRWDHLPLTDLLPALQVHTMDPALPGWPEPARSAVARLGGWYRLRRLTPLDLQSPGVPDSSEALLTTVFREIFTHLQAQAPLQERKIAAPAVPVTAPPAAPGEAPRGLPTGSTGSTGPFTGPAGIVAAPPRGANGHHPAGPATTGPPITGPATGPLPTRPSRATTTGPLPVRPAAAGPLPGGALTPGPFTTVAFTTGPTTTGPAPAQDRVPAAAPLPAPVPAAAPAPPAAPAAPPAVPSPSEHPMVSVVDGLFRGWDPITKAVAAQRLFAAEPVGLRALAHDLQVDREILSQAQRAAEERVLVWLRSSDSAPLTGHMFGLTEWLGAAATQEQLIAADPSHPVEVPALGTPLWRVLVTLMPDRRLQDGWLVVGDLAGLREKTRQLLTSKPADADVIELLGRLGIRAHSAKAWIDSMPEISGQDQGQLAGRHMQEELAEAAGKPAPLPRRTPGVNGHHHHRGGVPVPVQANNGPDAATALAALSALSAGVPRPHLVPGPRTPSSPASDPRRWQRIDVTSGHLRGDPVPVPEGYAAQLGMRPGTLLSVTGPGDNAVVLVWRDRQPVFDSLQPVLMRLNARPGDSVYVTVDGYRLEAQLT